MINIKSILLLIVIASISLTTTAQKITFVEPRFNLESPKPKLSSFDLNGKHYILLESSNLKAPLRLDLQLVSYDSNGKPLNSFMIDETMNGAEPNYFKGIFPIDGNIVLFKSGYNTKTKKMSLYSYIIDEEGNKGEAKKITSIQGTGMFNSGRFEVVASPDYTKILVLSNMPRVKKTNEKIVLTVYDNKLNELVTKEIELPYPSLKTLINNVYINNNGTSFLLKKVYAKKGLPDREMVFTFTPELKLISESAHKIGEIGVISTYKAMIDNDGNLVFGGLYYDYKKSGVNVSDPDGQFISKCTAEGILTSTFNIKHYSGSFVTNQLMSDAFGNFFLLIESVLYKSEAVGEGTAPVYSDLYTNKNSELIKFNSQQQIEWIYSIERDEQKSTNDNAKAHRVWATVLPSNQIAVIYLDSWARHDGIKRSVITPPVIYWKGDVIEIVSQEGKQDTHTLITDPRFGGKNGQYYLIPQTGYLVNGSIHMISFRNKELVSTIINL